MENLTTSRLSQRHRCFMFYEMNWDLPAPQFGCGEEMCGACMVLIGDKAKQSCKLPVSEVGRSRITTLEGLIEQGELHPVQRPFIEEQAAQCDYCIKGMIIRTTALLWKTPHP